MDFIVFSALLGVLISSLTLCYDICYQWSCNLQHHVLQLPPSMQVSPNKLLKKATYIIPKFHLHNHGLKCHLNFNLNFLQYSTQSDLKDPEHWWAHINPINMSPQEMTMGSCINILNDHAAGWNWRKTTGFGKFYYYLCIDIDHLFLVVGQQFYVQLKRAIEFSKKQRKAFEDFDKLFPIEIVQQWNAKVKAWDLDPSKPNPYTEPEAGKCSNH